MRPKSDVIKGQYGCYNELGSGNGGMMLLSANEPCMKCFPNFSHPNLPLNQTRGF